jgi:hypothetical protein
MPMRGKHWVNPENTVPSPPARPARPGTGGTAGAAWTRYA